MRVPVACLFLTAALTLGLNGCSPVAPSVSEILGTWEKEDAALPPINLMLSSDGAATRARLRLSGAEFNGAAVVDGDRLQLTFPDRQPIAGTFLSKTELALRLEASGREYTLKKR